MYGQSQSTKIRFDGFIFTVYKYFGLFCLNIPLYENYIDFSNGKDTTLISKNIEWGDWWFKKSTVRYNKLDKDNQLASEIKKLIKDIDQNWVPDRNFTAHSFVVVTNANKTIDKKERLEIVKRCAIAGEQHAINVRTRTDKIIRDMYR